MEGKGYLKSLLNEVVFDDVSTLIADTATISTLSVPSNLYVDNISEYTTSIGTTINNVLISNGEVDGVDVSNLETQVNTNTSDISDLQTEIQNFVSGPTSSVDNTFPRFSGTTGRIIKSSPVVCDDSGNITTSGNMSCTLVNGVSLAILSSQVSTNTSNIATNTSDISTLQTQLDNTTLQDIYDNSSNPQIVTTVTNPYLLLKDYSGTPSQTVLAVADSGGGVNFSVAANGNIVCSDINSVDLVQLYLDVQQNTADINSLTGDVDGFPDELKNLSTTEIQQLENIDSTSISTTQWGYVGAFDQGLRTVDTVTFFNCTAFAVYTNEIAPRSGTTTDICNTIFNDSTSIVDFPTSIQVDIINEHTGSSGVVIDGVICKDYDVTCTNLKAQTSVQTDSIVEQTLNNGVDIDGVVIKDGLVDGQDCSVLKNITSVEASQLENINSTTISTTQWGYVGNMNQNVATNSNVSFSSITLATGSSFNNYQEFSNTSFTFTCGFQSSSYTTTVKAVRLGNMVVVWMKWFSATLSTSFPFSTNPYFGSSSTLDSAFRPPNDIHNDSRRQSGGTWASGGNYICRSDGTVRIFEEATQSSNWNSGTATLESVCWCFTKN